MGSMTKTRLGEYKKGSGSVRGAVYRPGTKKRMGE